MNQSQMSEPTLLSLDIVPLGDSSAVVKPEAAGATDWTGPNQFLLAGSKRTASLTFECQESTNRGPKRQRLVPDFRSGFCLLSTDALLPCRSACAADANTPEAFCSTPPPLALKRLRRDLRASQPGRSTNLLATRRCLAAAFDAEAREAGLDTTGSPEACQPHTGDASGAPFGDQESAGAQQTEDCFSLAQGMRPKHPASKRLCFDDVEDDVEPSETATSPRFLATLHRAPVPGVSARLSLKAVTAAVPALSGEWSRQRLAGAGHSQRCVLDHGAFATASHMLSPGTPRSATAELLRGTSGSSRAACHSDADGQSARRFRFMR